MFLGGYIGGMGLSTETAQILLGRRIRSLRNAKKWTLEELGEQADTNHKHIGEIERGQQNPSFAVLVKIAGALGIDLIELFKFEMEALSRSELEGKIGEIVKSLPDEDVGRILSVFREIFPVS